MLVLGPLSGLMGSLLLALTIRVPSALLAAFGFFLFGVGPILWTISNTTLRQVITPPDMLGRVSALVIMATFGARPVGAAMGAFIGGRYGAESCILVAVGGFTIQLGVILASSVSRLTKLPEGAAA